MANYDKIHVKILSLHVACAPKTRPGQMLLSNCPDQVMVYEFNLLSNQIGLARVDADAKDAVLVAIVVDHLLGVVVEVIQASGVVLLTR